MNYFFFHFYQRGSLLLKTTENNSKSPRHVRERVITVVLLRSQGVNKQVALVQWTTRDNSLRRLWFVLDRLDRLLRRCRPFPTQLLTNVAPAHVLVFNFHCVIRRKPTTLAVSNSLPFQPTYENNRNDISFITSKLDIRCVAISRCLKLRVPAGDVTVTTKDITTVRPTIKISPIHDWGRLRTPPPPSECNCNCKSICKLNQCHPVPSS